MICAETMLYAPIKAYFEQHGYEVKGEVRSCDLVAMREGEAQPIIVELKRTFGLPVVYQAIDRLKLSDQVYIAVEIKETVRKAQTKKWKDAIKLCRLLGLGLITVKFYTSRKPRVDVLCDPEPYKPRSSRQGKKRLITEFQRRSGDYNVGGSTRRKLITAYREKSLQCAYWLAEKGELTTAQLRQLTGDNKITQLLYKNYYQWFERVGRGKYIVNNKGREALITYRHVIAHIFPDD